MGKIGKHLLSWSILLQYLAIFWFVNGQPWESEEGDVDCFKENQCVNYTMVGESGYLDCYGYFSCANGAHITTQAASSGSRCFASHACYGATAIIQRSNDSNAKYIQCRGLYSCANVDSIISIHGYIFCFAELSCYNSNIFQFSDIGGGYNMRCAAVNSCTNSIIQSINSYVDAYSGANNAIFMSNYSSLSNLNDINYQFGSRYGGDGATVICGIDQTCFIECFDNACSDLKLLCEGSINKDCFNITCDFAQKSDLCPNGFEFESNLIGINNIDDIFPNLKNITFTNNENSVNSCNSNDAFACDDYPQCTNDTSLSANAPVCCRASYSCQSKNNITSYVNSSIYSVSARWYVIYCCVLYY